MNREHETKESRPVLSDIKRQYEQIRETKISGEHEKRLSQDYRTTTKSHEYRTYSRDQQDYRTSRDHDHQTTPRDQEYRTSSRSQDYRRIPRDQEYRTISRDQEYRSSPRDQEYRITSRDQEYRTATRDQEYQSSRNNFRPSKYIDEEERSIPIEKDPGSKSVRNHVTRTFQSSQVYKGKHKHST